MLGVVVGDRVLRFLQTVGVFVAIGVAAVLYIHTNPRDANFPDFSVFYAAGAHGPIYDPVWITSIQPGAPGLRPFGYPPTFILICRFLRLLPYDLAFGLWSAVSGVLFVEGARRLAPRLWGLAAFTPAAVVAFREGQTSLLIGGLITLAFTLPKRPWLAGVIYGVAFSLKPQVLLLLPVLMVLDRSWRTLLAMGLSGVAVCLASLALGPSLWGDWLAAVPKLYKFTAFQDHLDASGPWWLAAAILAIAALLASLSRPPPVRLAAVIGGSLLLSPHAMFYEQAMLVPAAIGLSWPLTGSVLPGLFILLGRVTGPITLAIALVLNAAGSLIRLNFRDPQFPLTAQIEAAVAPD